MKEALPATAELVLESHEDQWRLLVNGLINELTSSALITINSGKRIRIQLCIKEIISPEKIKSSFISQINSNMDATTSRGILRISDFISNKLEKEKWVFVAEVQGSIKRPMVIVYYSALDIFVYSFQLHNENKESFMPDFLQN